MKKITSGGLSGLVVPGILLSIALIAIVLLGITLATGDASHHSEVELPPLWLVLPFVAILLCVAVGPLWFPHTWEKMLVWMPPLFGLGVISYYILVLGDPHHPVHATSEAISFISLVGSLYLVVSRGFRIKVDIMGKPTVNVLLLALGAILANIIGTTGAAVLLIGPFMNVNRDRFRTHHVLFFIFIVANVAGLITPIGDPPIFLGFLKGVPFSWQLSNLSWEWLISVAAILIIFYEFDRRDSADTHKGDDFLPDWQNPVFKFRINGRLVFSAVFRANFAFGRVIHDQIPEKRPTASSHTMFENTASVDFSVGSLLSLVVILLAVFLDPNVIPGFPALHIGGIQVSFVRELIQIGAAIFGYYGARGDIVKHNKPSLEPLKEVSFVFWGIFWTMIPALQLIANFAASSAGVTLINEDSLYWFTGVLSGFLDNAPTYMNFLTAAMSQVGMDVNDPVAVQAFAVGANNIALKLISVAAVFFGALTYIGNGPNLLTKGIVQSAGRGDVVPSFFKYMAYSVPIMGGIGFLAYSMIKWGITSGVIVISAYYLFFFIRRTVIARRNHVKEKELSVGFSHK